MLGATQQGLWTQLGTLADAVVDKTSHFPKARHIIGRLSSRIRAPRDMLISLQDSAGDFEALRAQVTVIEVPPMPAAPWPAPDNHTSLDGILGRMVGADYPRLGEIKARLLFLDMILEREPLQAVLLNYAQSEPFVHAEVRVLERLSSIQADFFNGDRYIYTSKPACYCCRLYFREHPANMIVPESHSKIPPHWGFPLVQDFRKDDRDSRMQRDLINEMNRVIRREALDQIESISMPPGWHTDSTTGVPSISSLDGMSVFSDDMSPMQEINTGGVSILESGQVTPRPLTPEPN